MKASLSLLAFMAMALFGSSQINTFPYLETFDSFPVDNVTFGPGTEPNPFPNGWDNVQTGDDAQDWYGRSVATGSTGTGPGADHTSGSGVYVFVEDGFGNFTDVHLISPSIDVSGLATPTLSFWTHSNEANGALATNTMSVDVFYNGVWNLAVDQYGQLSNNWEERLVNLSAYPGVIQVRFRGDNSTTSFTHDIAIDDFRVFDLPAADAGVDQAELDPRGYYMIPIQQAGLKFAGRVSNNGTDTLNNVHMEVTVGSFIDTASIPFLVAGDDSNLVTPTTFIPPSTGLYNAQYVVHVDELDTITFNDSADYEFIITDTVYSREDSSLTGGIGFNNALGIFGQMFEINTTDTLTSASFWLDAPTVGDSMKVRIYNFSNNTPGTQIGSTETLTIPVNTGAWYSLRFDCPIVLTPGQYFLAADQLSMNNLSIGYTDQFYAPDVTYFNANSTAWTAFETVPFFVSLLLRANFGPVPIVSAEVVNDTVCRGDTATLLASGVSTYTWTPTTGLSSATGDSISAVPPSTTEYTVTGSDAFGCPSTDTVTVTVNQLPEPNLGNDTAFCDGESAVLNAAPGLSYVWLNDSSTNSSLTVDSAGTYTVWVTDSNNCSNLDSLQVTLYDLPQPNLGNDTIFCPGESTNLDGGDFVSFLWSDNSTLPFLTISTPGPYWVQITDSNGCSATDTMNLANHTLPVVNLGNDTTTQNSDPLTLDAGTGFSTYLWPDLSMDQTFTVTVSGTYIVQVTDSNGCPGSDTIVVNIWPVGITELGREISIKAFPNPVSNYVTVELPKEVTKGHFTLYDLEGKLVLNQPVPVSAQGSQITLDLSGIASGSYLLEWRNTEFSSVIPVIVQR